jgi:hypothetical protein
MPRGIIPQLAQPVLRALSRSLARSTAQCDAISQAAPASTRLDQPAVSVAARAAAARCAVTSLRYVRRSLHRMAACPRRRTATATIPAPVVAALSRKAGKQFKWPLGVETTGIFLRRVSICIETKLSWPLDRPLEQKVRTPYFFDGVFDRASRNNYDV